MTANSTFSESNIPADIQEGEAIVKHEAKPLQLARYDAARTALAEAYESMKSRTFATRPRRCKNTRAKPGSAINSICRRHSAPRRTAGR